MLNVYADRPFAFEDAERRVLTQPGVVVGHAIAAVERKRALMSDEVVELEFHVEDTFEALGVGDDLQGRIELDQAVPAGGEEYLLYGSATEDVRPGVDAIADSLGVSPPTFHQHLRKAERELFDTLLSGSTPRSGAVLR